MSSFSSMSGVTGGGGRGPPNMSVCQALDGLTFGDALQEPSLGDGSSAAVLGAAVRTTKQLPLSAGSGTVTCRPVLRVLPALVDDEHGRPESEEDLSREWCWRKVSTRDLALAESTGFEVLQKLCCVEPACEELSCLAAFRAASSNIRPGLDSC